MAYPPKSVPVRSAATKPRRWIRRRVIIIAGIQFRIVRPILLFALLQALLVLGFVVYPAQRSARLDPNIVVRSMLSSQLLDIQTRLWPVFGLALALAGVHTLTRSNRLAGPLYKLRKSLLLMSEGKFQEMRFRQGDELRDFEEVVNRLGRKLESLSSESNRKAASLEKRLKWLVMHVEYHNPPKEEVIRELENVMREFSHLEITPTGQA